MRDRVHRYLDGELTREELTPEELVEVESVEATLGLLRADGARFDDVDLAPGVLASIAARPHAAAPSPEDRPSIVRRCFDWLLGPREISLRLRPAYGLAAILAIAAGAWLLPLLSPSGAPPTVAEANASPRVFVRFELDAPGATSVRLAGSFSRWQPDISLHKVRNGRWVALVPLPPGVHDYAFQVDGERWTVDPSAPRVADGFGGYNSRLSLVLTNS